MTTENKNNILDTYYNFVKDNIVYIHGDFDEGISKQVIPKFKALIEWQKDYREAKIEIDICSPGGYVSILAELLAQVEIAKSHDIIVETRAMSQAHSCGSILLASGTKGHRFGSPYTQVLVHHASMWNHSATDIQLEREYEKAKHVNRVLESLLKRYTDIPAKTLTSMLSDDSYYVYGQDLIKFGIIDEFTYEL